MFSFIFVGYISNLIALHFNLWEYHIIARNAVGLGCAAYSFLFLFGMVLTA